MGCSPSQGKKNPIIDFDTNTFYDSSGNVWGYFGESNSRRFYAANGNENMTISNTQTNFGQAVRMAGLLEIAKMLKYVYVPKTADYTVQITDNFMQKIDATAGNVTATLPSAVGNQYLVYCFERKDSSGNTVTIDPAGSETIAGLSSLSLSSLESVWIESDGANWFVIANN